MICTLILATVAGAEPETQLSVLQAQAGKQDALLEEEIGDVAAVDHELEQAQAEAGVARSRVEELEARSGELEVDLSVQQKTYEQARAGYEQRARAAYRGDDVDALATFLEGIFSPDEGAGDQVNIQTAALLLEGRENLDSYQESRRMISNTVRQVERKEAEYEDALEEERRRTKELRREEEQLDASISRIKDQKTRTDARIQQLRQEERERITKTRPATGGHGGQKSSELRIAREEIVVRRVEPVSKKKYVKLYKESAKKYGFEKDWYILAAVGKVESDHGENMGPSSAGALGPMQFLPSTWKTSGVDGNGDGVTNVMDPEDAIPAAAKYLKTGGAPKDWYAALYSYNHADWYVKKVLGVAEGYRRLAKDDRVGPYI